MQERRRSDTTFRAKVAHEEEDEGNFFRDPGDRNRHVSEFEMTERSRGREENVQPYWSGSERVTSALEQRELEQKLFRHNQLRRSFYGKFPKGYKRSDERILDDICQRLMAFGKFDPRNIEVSVKEGEVFLEGSVESKKARREVQDEIERVLGILDIHNRLQVFPENHRAEF